MEENVSPVVAETHDSAVGNYLIEKKQLATRRDKCMLGFIGGAFSGLSAAALSMPLAAAWLIFAGVMSLIVAGDYNDRLRKLQQPAISQQIEPTSVTVPQLEAKSELDALIARADEHKDDDQFSEAAVLYEQAIVLLKGDSPIDEEKVALAMGNLGHAYYEMGQSAQAISVLQRAAEMHEKLNLLVSLSFNLTYLGRALMKEKRIWEAAGIFERVLTLDEDQEVDVSEENLIEDKYDLGATLHEVGQHKKANKLLSEVREFYLDTYGKHSIELAGCNYHLALTWIALNKPIKAKRLLAEALKTLAAERAMGKTPDLLPDLLSIYQKLVPEPLWKERGLDRLAESLKKTE